MIINKELINKILLVISLLILMLISIFGLMSGLIYAHDETELGHQVINMLGGYLLK